MTACPPLMMRIFISSNGDTSGTNCTPTSSSRGRPVGNRSSRTHCRKGSQKNGPGVLDNQKSSARMRRSRSVVAGVNAVDHAVRKGDVVLDPSIARKPGSLRRARPTKASAVTWPLWGCCAQHMTVNGATPAERRRASAASISPKTVFGFSGSPASATMSGCSGLNRPEAASMNSRLP